MGAVCFSYIWFLLKDTYIIGIVFIPFQSITSAAKNWMNNSESI